MVFPIDTATTLTATAGLEPAWGIGSSSSFNDVNDEVAGMNFSMGIMVVRLRKLLTHWGVFKFQKCPRQREF